jgi:hypothetical protein
MYQFISKSPTYGTTVLCDSFAGVAKRRQLAALFTQHPNACVVM